MSTVDRPTPGAEPFSDRLAFETLLADVFALFIDVRPGDVDREIEGALRRVCERLDLDLAVLWQWSTSDPSVVVPTHAYPAREGVLPPRWSVQQYPWTARQVLAGRAIVLASLDDAPPEAAIDRETASRAGIKSNLTLPLAAGGERPVGALAISTVRVKRDWPDVMVRGLQRVAQVFTTVLARKRADEALRESEARLAAGADLAGLAFYEVDFEKGTMYVDDRLRDICGVPQDVRGLQVLEFWQERLHPDDRQIVLDERQRMHDGELAQVSREYRFLNPIRGERWIHHMGGIAARDAAGRAPRTFGVFRDITTQKQAEESLRQTLAEVERLKDRLQAESDYLKIEIGVSVNLGGVTGKSAAIQKVLRLVEQVAPTDSLVLLSGETGTGKERVAEAIHRLSPRRSQVMVKVNCAALPSGLVESELFGREKGAFTGALARQVGRFEIADGSTLFLDEIGELSLELQAKLLRVLESGEFERLGSPRTIKVNARLIAATNRDLTEEIRKGRFREDLFYRLAVFPIRVPPLRDRTEDVPQMVWEFLEQFNARMGKKITRVPRATMAALQHHSWPGNVRELRNVIERGAIIATGNTLEVSTPAASTSDNAMKQTLADVERSHILGILERTGWRVKGPNGAAAVLGLNPGTLYGRMKKLGITVHRSSPDRP